MKFVSSRELRINPGGVWKLLRKEKDLVVTSNGKPVGVLTSTDEGQLEQVFDTLRQARAQAAVAELRRVAVERGLDALGDAQIEAVVGKVRRARRGRAARRVVRQAAR